MFNVAALKDFLSPFAWFLTLGKTDTEQMRDEIRDLLVHAGQSIRTLIELEQILAGLDEKDFDFRGFGNVYLHCEYAYTGNEAPDLARTHCSDISRDLRRINFKTAKLLRTEWGEWKGIGESFASLEDADRTFLDDFGDSLKRISTELKAIFELLERADRDKDTALKDVAWKRFSGLRSDLRNDVNGLQAVVAELRAAEDHVRNVLT